MEDFEKKRIRNREIQFRDGESANEIPGVEYFGSDLFGIYVLPAGTDTENLDAFVRDPASRPMLEIHGNFLLPEGTFAPSYCARSSPSISRISYPLVSRPLCRYPSFTSMEGVM